MDDVRKIQEEALALGLVDRMNKVLDWPGLHKFAVERKIRDSVLDLAFGFPSGTTAAYCIANGVTPLKGEELPPPIPSSVFGSGFEGKPGETPAGPAEVNAPPVPETKEQRLERFKVYMDQRRWQVPGDELALYHDIPREGFFYGEVEEWLSISTGGIKAVYAARGGVPNDLP